MEKGLGISCGVHTVMQTFDAAKREQCEPVWFVRAQGARTLVHIPGRAIGQILDNGIARSNNWDFQFMTNWRFHLKQHTTIQDKSEK